MITKKSSIVPFKVPWKIASDLCYFDLKQDAQNRPLSLIFTAYFHKHETVNNDWNGETTTVVSEDIELYRQVKPDENAPYHRVKIHFSNGKLVRRVPEYQGATYFDPQLFDFSKAPFIEYLPDETPENYVDRVFRYRAETGFEATPGCFEVEESFWIKEEFPDEQKLKHFIFCDEIDAQSYLEIIAKDWSWELGQPTN